MQTFQDFGLKPQILQAITGLGYTVPTQIQQEVWALASEGKNVVGQSQTGTGKTTAFLLPLLEAISNRDRFPQVLIVAPTRELVAQIREDIMTLTKHYPMRSMMLIGGRAKRFQMEDLKYGPQFIVATPGRLIEFIQENRIDTSKITHFVLDEVDRMLDMGFIEDVDRIWGQLTNLKQTMTFSATINDDIKRVITRHVTDYVHIKVGEQITVDKIDHTYIDMAHEHKFTTLMSLLNHHKNEKCIVFAQTKRNTEVICRALQDAKHTAQYLNGDLEQRERTRALKAFKEGAIKILVTTDVAARGLNMDNVQLVVNFEVPREPESYIHRIGRTGRAGADGKAIMFVSPDEKHLLMDIERTQKIKLKKSVQHITVEDTKEDYLDLNLDLPLPPSEKKRRMVARMSRSVIGGYGSDGRRNDDRAGRGGYAGRSGGSSRSGQGSFGGRSSDRGGFGGERRTFSSSSDRPQRTFSDRPQRSFDSPATGAARPARPARQFDAKPEPRGRYGDRKAAMDGGFGDNNFSTPRTRTARPTRSIGGYDPEFVVQTNMNAARAPRPRTSLDFPTSRDSRGGSRSSDSRGGDRGGFAPRAPRTTGERSASSPRTADRAPVRRAPTERSAAPRAPRVAKAAE